MAANNILIGGGTGFIGSHLSKTFRSKGYGVTVISRMPGPQRISWNDLADKGLPKDVTAVINLAGQNVMDFTRRWTSGFKQNAFNSRVNTTTSLAKAINEAKIKPKVFVGISGVGGYKPNVDKQYTEESSVENFDFFSNLVYHWEEAADLARNCRVVKIRSGVVLGRDGGMIKDLYLPFSLGLGGPIGNGQQYLPWIHIDDLVNIIAFAVENTNVSGVLNGVAPQVISNKEFSKAFAKALNRPAFIPTPAFVMNLVFGAERAKMITEGQKVLPKRTQELGYKFRYPDIDTACRAIVTNS